MNEFQGKTLLLTGATGLIGGALGLEWVRRGGKVRALVRDVERAKLTLPFPAEILLWENVDVNGVDFVAHLAGENIAEQRWSASRKEAIRSSRIDSTRNLMSALTRANAEPQAVLNASAIGWYGNQGDDWLEEDSPPGSDFLSQLCVEWEEALFVSEFAKKRKGKTRFLALRTGIVLSETGAALSKMIPLFQAGLGGKLGDGNSWMSVIHLDDLIRVILFLFSNAEAQGSFNAVCPMPIRNKDFTEVLAHVLGVSKGPAVPKIALQLKLGSEMAGIVLSSQRVRPKKLSSLGFTFQFPDAGSALRNAAHEYREGVKLLLTKQWLPRPVDELFSFYSSEKNLEALTPAFLNFHVEGKTTEKIENGTLIHYRLKIRGVPVRWTSKIEDWAPPEKFVDVQLKGPYSLWHHTHLFATLGEGTLIEDRVRYRLPLGKWANVFMGGFVQRDVQEIFRYRKKVLHSLYGEFGSPRKITKSASFP